VSGLTDKLETFEKQKHTRVKLYAPNTVASPILLYGIMHWTVTAKEKLELQILKWNLWEERQNTLECTERDLKTQPTSDKIPKFKTDWIQHVVRMQGNGFLILFKKFERRGPGNGESCAKRFLYQLNQTESTNGPTLDVDDACEDWLIMMINFYWYDEYVACMHVCLFIQAFLTVLYSVEWNVNCEWGAETLKMSGRGLFKVAL
jgi:hypothetical protein